MDASLVVGHRKDGLHSVKGLISQGTGGSLNLGEALGRNKGPQ